MGIGSRIKDYLSSRGISQAWVCEKTGIKAPTLSMTLSEKRRMTFDDYELIVGALEVDGGKFIVPRKKAKDEPAD